LPDYDNLIKTLKADDGPRTQLLKGCLTKLGLEVNTDTASVPPLSALHLTALYSDEVQELAQSWDDIISKEGNDVLIRSENDILKVIAGSDVGDAPAEVFAEGDTYIKPLLVHDSGYPDPSAVPSFDFDEFYNRLQFYRKAKDPEAREWGNLLLYGKVVTSTNTMLEKYVSYYLPPLGAINADSTPWLWMLTFCHLQEPQASLDSPDGVYLHGENPDRRTRPGLQRLGGSAGPADLLDCHQPPAQDSLLQTYDFHPVSSRHRHRRGDP